MFVSPSIRSHDSPTRRPLVDNLQTRSRVLKCHPSVLHQETGPPEEVPCVPLVATLNCPRISCPVKADFRRTKVGLQRNTVGDFAWEGRADTTKRSDQPAQSKKFMPFPMVSIHFKEKCYSVTPSDSQGVAQEKRRVRERDIFMRQGKNGALDGVSIFELNSWERMGLSQRHSDPERG